MGLIILFEYCNPLFWHIYHSGAKRASGISLRIRFYSPQKVTVFPFPKCMVTLISGCCSFVESQEENNSTCVWRVLCLTFILEGLGLGTWRGCDFHFWWFMCLSASVCHTSSCLFVWVGDQQTFSVGAHIWNVLEFVCYSLWKNCPTQLLKC